ncbi:MAG: aspartate aminotransferase family protein [Bacteroidota bacterium]
MKLLNVYPLFDLEPVRAEGSYFWDKKGVKYLDLYGGHAVISIGHSHPHYVERITEQLQKIGFYSNSVHNSLQLALGEKLSKLSGLTNFRLFLVNSGAEAIENALKMAAFHTARGTHTPPKKVIAVKGAFHGRTSAAVAVTDNPKIRTALNPADHVVHIPFNDIQTLEKEMENSSVCAVILEGIQGVAGAYTPTQEFWIAARRLCDQHGAVLIADEVQSGFARSGKFFAFQHAGVIPDIITMAKGMGNGFPIGGILVNQSFDAWYGMLGTTFGGNHLAMSASLAVLEVIEEENLMENAKTVGEYLEKSLLKIQGIREIRGMGLMRGIELDRPAKGVRKELLFAHQIFTGSSAQPHTLRILPPLNIKQEQLDSFVSALDTVLKKEYVSI